MTIELLSADEVRFSCMGLGVGVRVWVILCVVTLEISSSDNREKKVVSMTWLVLVCYLGASPAEAPETPHHSPLPHAAPPWKPPTGRGSDLDHLHLQATSRNSFFPGPNVPAHSEAPSSYDPGPQRSWLRFEAPLRTKPFPGFSEGLSGRRFYRKLQ